MKKRALLALACAKKVMPVWSKYDPLDKRPQKLIKMSLAYLDGKITVIQKIDKTFKRNLFWNRLWRIQLFDYGICPFCQNKVYKVLHAGTNRRLDWYDYLGGKR